MSKFKVGDKVRVVNNGGWSALEVGAEGTVAVIRPAYENGLDLVEVDGMRHYGGIFSDRLELVEEPSRLTNFKVGDKVRRKADSYCLGWEDGDKVCEVASIYVRRDRSQSLTLKGIKDYGWDGFRFELVEEPKPAVPAVPQIPGIPEGFRAVRVGTPKRGEWYVNTDGEAEQSKGFQFSKSYTILEKIDQPAPVEPAKPEAPVAPVKKVAPVFKVGDKVRLLDNKGYEEFPVGTVDMITEALPDIPANGHLLMFAGPLEAANGMFAYRFELVTESPDDLVIQDRVPAREGIDFGWWVADEEFDNWVPCPHKKWSVTVDPNARKERHGHTLRNGDRLFVMCYRKDLPVLPTTEKVLLKEYLVWGDDNQIKCLVWSTDDPTTENDEFEHWPYAHPTGNTREVEVPLVKA